MSDETNPPSAPKLPGPGPDSMLSAAGKNDNAMLYATFNFAQSKSGGENSNAAIDQGAQMACVAAGAAFGVPPAISAQAGKMLAAEIKDKRDEDKNKENNKPSSPSLSIGGLK